MSGLKAVTTAGCGNTLIGSPAFIGAPAPGGMVMSKATLNQAQQLLNLISQSGIGKDQLQALLVSGQLTTLLREYVEGATFEVTIDNNVSLVTAIDRGRYEIDCVSPNLEYYFLSDVRRPTPTNSGKEGRERTKIHLLHLGCKMTVTEGLIQLDRRGLRPVILRELAALGETYPILQLQWPILALGSQADTDNPDDLQYPFLTEEHHQRALDIFRTSQMGKIPDRYRLAGVRR